MFYITACFYILFLFFSSSVFALESPKINLFNDFTFTPGLSFSNAFQANGTNFQTDNVPNQGGDSQPISAMAHIPKYISLRGNLNANDFISLHARIDYYWNIPLQLGLFQQSLSVHKLLLKDFYFEMPNAKYELNIWAGVRTFEFKPITLFALPNPFDQNNLQGFGIETHSMQAAFSVNKGHVNTIATSTLLSTDSSGNIVSNEQLIVDNNGNPVYYGLNEYIASIFVSGKLVLPEGHYFEPIFSFRYYLGGRNKSQPPNNGNYYKAKAGSGLIAGGIYSRPISNGIAGTTTVWFSSLPSDSPVTSATLPINNAYAGAGRVKPNTPANTIGLLDSSEFYFLEEAGILTAIYLANNTYATNYPILKASGDGSRLQSDGSSKTNTNNMVTIAIEPLVFLNRYLIVGLDIYGSYVTEKIFQDDANSIVFSPLLKWSFDDKLNSNQYLFTSVSYGIYDWKSKELSDKTKSNILFSMQFGAKIDL